MCSPFVVLYVDSSLFVEYISYKDAHAIGMSNNESRTWFLKNKHVFSSSFAMIQTEIFMFCNTADAPSLIPGSEIYCKRDGDFCHRYWMVSRQLCTLDSTSHTYDKDYGMLYSRCAALKYMRNNDQVSTVYKLVVNIPLRSPTNKFEWDDISWTQDLNPRGIMIVYMKNILDSLSASKILVGVPHVICFAVHHSDHQLVNNAPGRIFNYGLHHYKASHGLLTSFVDTHLKIREPDIQEPTKKRKTKRATTNRNTKRNK